MLQSPNPVSAVEKALPQYHHSFPLINLSGSPRSFKASRRNAYHSDMRSSWNYITRMNLSDQVVTQSISRSGGLPIVNIIGS